MSSYVYELELLFRMKIHSMFHVNLLWFLKNDSINRQVSLSQFMIVKNEKDSYFVNLINNMKWNMKSVQFELLIRWEKYE